VRPYRDYATWLQEQDLAADEAFWRRVLHGFSTPVALPREKGSKDPASSRANHHQEQALRLSGELSQALRQYAASHQLTLNALCQGAWAFVLSRYSGQKDVIFGVVRSCRWGTLPEAESMLGLFVNTLPVRIQIADKAELIPWLKSLHAWGVATRDHQFASLSQIQQWSQLPGSVPLFESAFIFEHRTLHNTLQSYGGSWCKRDISLYRKPNYPLAIYIFAETEILVCGIYDEKVFSRAMITRMLRHFQDTLAAIASGTSLRLEVLPPVCEEDRKLLLSLWNATRQDYPRDKCIHQLVEAQAARFSGSLALQTETQSLTYDQVNKQANRIAHWLRSLGSEPDTCVGICMQRSAEAIVSQLGILKAGSAFLMLDPEYPQERLRFQIEDARIRIILTQQQYTKQLPEREDILIMIIDTPADPLSGWSDENPLNRATGNNLAYIIYTSGSTGLPKGVQIQHNGLMNVSAWYRSTFQIQPQDRVTHLAALTFDASVLEIWPCLSAGASLHLIDEEARIQPRSLINWLSEHSITIAFLPTPLGEAVLQQTWPDKTSLRALTIGGDRLTRAPGPGVPFDVYNLYGPTETSIVATWTLVLPGPASALPPIGRPIANTQVYVLDEQLALIPIGAIGELFIGGDGLARGYLNRPELTASCFIQNPFGGQPETRVYRSGDLVRYQQEGALEYIGRTDNQVKIRGLRIELLEIEAILSQHPAVNMAVVLVRENDHHEKRLLAYVLPEQQVLFDTKSVRHFLQQKLPAYMIPTDLVVLASMPFTSVGKVDRRALAAMKVDLVEPETPYALPETPAEQALAAIWEDVFKDRPHKEQPIGIHDNFFDLGGHSLLAGRIIQQVKKRMDVHLPLRALFHAPTIAALATYIEQLSTD